MYALWVYLTIIAVAIAVGALLFGVILLFLLVQAEAKRLPSALSKAFARAFGSAAEKIQLARHFTRKTPQHSG
jgi:hypothetical protein